MVKLPTAARVSVGKLVELDLPAGCYIYFGSALNGLQARIARHFRSEKKLHWHIDFLVGAAFEIEARQLADGQRWECEWATQAANNSAAIAPTPGFGASDCRCRTHLFGVESPIDARILLTGLQPPPQPIQE